ncbi:MAG: hypothetical protein SCH71_04870 [Desulfobulbaceae bacterium]|nr:hypothetical protein [Desulfobulbaceae bacterium]
MPSSISNSNGNNRSNGWLRALAGGLLIALFLLAAWEVFWRISGFSPVMEDDLGIWTLKRRAVEKENGRTAVLMGASRMQLDVDPRVFQAETGLQTVMLAIDGSSPLPVLADLAGDNSFAGLVLCSLLPQWLADGGVDEGRSAKWVRKFRQQKWSSRVETRLSLLLQSNFVFRYPGLLPDRLWQNFLEGEAPRPPYAPMRNDRYRPADYSLINIAELRAARIKRQREIVAAAEPLSGEEFAQRVSEIEAMVRQILERGGRVIFLRLPSCGEILKLEEETWPRRRYWDRFAANTAARTVHFADYPELAGFECPEDSHLDFRDAEKFTRNLADVLNLQAR